MRLNIRKKNIVFIILYLITSTIIGFQLLGYDRDYSEYFHIFQSEPETLLDDARYEIGFIYLVIFLQNLYLPTWSFYLLIALFTIWTKLLLIKKTSGTSLLPYIYYFSPFIILHDDTQIRLAMAMAILPWLIYHYQIRSIIYFITLGLFAISFHYQSLLNILIIPIAFWVSSKIINKHFITYLLIIIFILFFLSFNINNIIGFASQYNSKIETYIVSESTPNYFNIMILANLALSIWGSKIILTSSDSKMKVYWIMGITGVLLYYLLIKQGSLSHRIAESFLFLNCFWIGYSLKNKHYYGIKYIAHFIVLSLALLTLYSSFFSDKPYYFSTPLELSE